MNCKKKHRRRQVYQIRCKDCGQIDYDCKQCEDLKAEISRVSRIAERRHRSIVELQIKHKAEIEVRREQVITAEAAVEIAEAKTKEKLKWLAKIRKEIKSR